MFAGAELVTEREIREADVWAGKLDGNDASDDKGGSAATVLVKNTVLCAAGKVVVLNPRTLPATLTSVHSTKIPRVVFIGMAKHCCPLPQT